MKYLIFISLLSLTFTQELKVEGNLNVTGSIQNQTIDSLLQVISNLQAQIDSLINSNSNLLKYKFFDVTFINSEIHEYQHISIESLVGEDLPLYNITFSELINYECYSCESVTNYRIGLSIPNHGVTNSITDCELSNIGNGDIITNIYCDFPLYGGNSEIYLDSSTHTLSATIRFLAVAPFEN